MNGDFMFEFGYCPLVYMCSSVEQLVVVVWSNFLSSFLVLLEKDKSATLHHRNWQTQAYEIFKIKNNRVPQILT